MIQQKIKSTIHCYFGKSTKQYHQSSPYFSLRVLAPISLVINHSFFLFSFLITSSPRHTNNFVNTHSTFLNEISFRKFANNTTLENASFCFCNKNFYKFSTTCWKINFFLYKFSYFLSLFYIF